MSKANTPVVSEFRNDFVPLLLDRSSSGVVQNVNHRFGCQTHTQKLDETTNIYHVSAIEKKTKKQNRNVHMVQ